MDIKENMKTYLFVHKIEQVQVNLGWYKICAANQQLYVGDVHLVLMKILLDFRKTLCQDKKF